MSYIPEGHQFPGSATSNPSIANIVPDLRKDQQTLEAWVCTPAGMAIVGLNRYQGNNVEAVMPYDSLGNLLSSYSTPPGVPQCQGLAGDMRKRSERKYWCTDCGTGCTQSQVLGRHIKDKHETKQSCPFCSFTWSRGRPHLYRKHLQMRHPQITPPEVQRKGFKVRQGTFRPHAKRTVRITNPKSLPLPLCLLAPTMTV